MTPQELNDELKRDADRLGIHVVRGKDGIWRLPTDRERAAKRRKDDKERMDRIHAKVAAEHKARRVAAITYMMARLTERWPDVEFTHDDETISARIGPMAVTITPTYVHSDGRPVAFFIKTTIGWRSKEIKDFGSMGHTIDELGTSTDPIRFIEQAAHINLDHSRRLMADAIEAKRAVLGIKPCPCVLTGAEIAAEMVATADDDAENGPAEDAMEPTR